MESPVNIQNEPPNATLGPDAEIGRLYSRAGILYLELDAKGVIVSMNATVEDALSCDASEYIGKEGWALSRGLDKDHFKLIFMRCLRKGLIQSENAVFYGQKDEILEVVLNGIVKTDDAGRPAVVQFYAVDHTAQNHQASLNRLSLNVMPLLPLSFKRIPEFLENIRECFSLTYIGFAWPEHGRIHVLDTMDSTRHSQPVCLSWPPDQWQKLAVFLSDPQYAESENKGWTNNLADRLLDADGGGFLQIESLFYDIRFAAVWPVKLAGEKKGYLYALSRRPVHFTHQTFQLIQTMAQHLSILTEKKQDTAERPDRLQNKAIFDHPLMGALILRDGIISEANSWVCQFLGFRRSALIGRRLKDLAVERDLELLDRCIGGGFNEERAAGTVQFTLIDHRDNEKGVEAYFDKIEIENKTAQVWYIISRVMEFKLKQQLRQARKTEASGLLAGGLVHDFNNLMASVLGYSSLLNEEIDDKSPYKEDVLQIYKTAEQASERVARLMSYAQNMQCRIDDLNVNQLVKEVAGILSRTSDRNISIRAELEPNIIAFAADASQIQQLILQLALNARDAMPTGGKLFFRTQNTEVGDRGLRKKQGVKPGHYVQISVSDTGSGILPEHKARLFDDDFSTKERGSGQGTGLFFVKEIIEAHHGFISVFSEPGNGTMVKVHFPVKPYASEMLDLEEDDAPLMGDEHILLVDEQPIFRETAQKMLRRYGYKVVCAKSSNEAVSLIKKHGQEIDLIVLDMHLSGPLIHRVMHRLHQLKADAKIIAVTERGEDLKPYQPRTFQLAGRVEKPYQVRPLMRAIRIAMDV